MPNASSIVANWLLRYVVAIAIIGDGGNAAGGAVGITVGVNGVGSSVDGKKSYSIIPNNKKGRKK